MADSDNKNCRENDWEPRLETALSRLRQRLEELGSIAVAFSGGVDSSFLLKFSVDALGPQNVLALTATSEIHPRGETKEAEDFARELGVRHIVLETHELDNPEFTANPPERCYICKKALLPLLMDTAQKHGFNHLAVGENTDDDKDFRPGHRALRELGTLTPLKDAGLSKDMIREFSRRLGLRTADKPSMACLATRFPYGAQIQRPQLKLVSEAEEFLRSLGFVQVRVRIHGNMARIELDPKEINRLLDPDLRNAVARNLKKIGFRYAALDLEGYRTGALNQGLI